MKKVIIVIVVILVIGAGAYAYMSKKKWSDVKPDSGRIMSSSEVETPSGKLKAANFSGKLEEVNTACFADGECYIVVDGKHVTTMMGWNREPAGQILGVSDFGELESRIGADVEIYAKDEGDGTYSLLGSEGFYVKLLK